MDITASQIESIVRSVLSGIDTKSTARAPASGMAKVSMLTATKQMEIQQFPIPTIGDDEILVKVEGCGICGTDVHEWKGDPFGLIPVILGHEGTGEVIAIGKNVKQDTLGKDIHIGDKLVTSVISCGTCHNCRMHPDTPNLCENQGIYGLISDTGTTNHLSGWFASHIRITAGSTFFVVNDLNLEQRMLLELAAVAVHALQRAKKTGLLHFDSKVVIQGCGPVGLMMVAVLHTFGVHHIIAVDGSDMRLDLAKQFGAKQTISFKNLPTLDERVAEVKKVTFNQGADFAFQCTGAPAAAADVYKYIRRGGGLCEMGFFVDNGDATINPHFDLCNKEITLVGSWVYGAEEYPLTMAFLHQAKEIGVPLEKMITHQYPLEKMNEAMETNVAQKGIKIAYVAD